jgi:hypothetical protein
MIEEKGDIDVIGLFIYYFVKSFVFECLLINFRGIDLICNRKINN